MWGNRQVKGMPVSEAVVGATQPYIEGWYVDFTSDSDPRVSKLGRMRVVVPASRLVFGLSALHGDISKKLPSLSPPYAKVFTLEPSAADDNELMKGFQKLATSQHALRGAMYWCIDEEAGSSRPFYMSAGLGQMLGLVHTKAGDKTCTAAD